MDCYRGDGVDTPIFAHDEFQHEEDDEQVDESADLEEDCEENEDDQEVQSENESENTGGGNVCDSYDEDVININSMVDIRMVDMHRISIEDVGRYRFSELEIAYQFYCWYGRIVGFSVRKDHILKNNDGEIVQQTYLCSRAGLRREINNRYTRKRRPTNVTRCGCQAMCRVHVDCASRVWYVAFWNFDHNHDLLESLHCSLLPLHRRMGESDKMQIYNFRKVGITGPQMYASFANVAGGYDKVGFIRKDIYNEQGRMRKRKTSDAGGALKYLHQLFEKDPMMFVAYTVDECQRLQNLFWCDGESKLNYSVFGDVVAFDATYKKNKYLCPVVIFSGVNHHNHTTVFAAAVVTNETENTYVWLLEQFLEAMNGKPPSSVITDGDIAMKNAIKRVFPNAHHRLCAWHLMRNATSHVRDNRVLKCLKTLILSDFDVYEFEERWRDMVVKYELEDNSWITELYGRKKMWSPAHIRGNFFAGIRTTSRCEALHSHVSKYVSVKCNLTDFVEQFQRCLTYFRYREVVADYFSNYGNVVLETNLQSLERSAAKVLTKEIFFILRPTIAKTVKLRVVECKEMAMFSVYTVVKYRSGCTWHVSYCPSSYEFNCSCLRMESMGIPCDHIVSVLVCLNITEFPKSLLAGRWSKSATESIKGQFPEASMYWESQHIGRYATLLQLSRQVCEAAYRVEEDYEDTLLMLSNHLKKLNLKNRNTCSQQNIQRERLSDTAFDGILDPVVIGRNSEHQSMNDESNRRRRIQRCGRCGAVGHNIRRCTAAFQSEQQAGGGYDIPSGGDNYNYAMFMENPDSFIPSTSRRNV